MTKAVLDRNWHIGVCGWKHEGRHMRLAELLTLTDDEDERRRLVADHRNALLLLSCVAAKLQGEIDEVTT